MRRLKNACSKDAEWGLSTFPDEMPREEIRGLIQSKFPDVYGPAQEETSLLGYVPETLKAIGAGGAGMVESALTGAAFYFLKKLNRLRERCRNRRGRTRFPQWKPTKAPRPDAWHWLHVTFPATGLIGAGGRAAMAAGTALGVGAGAGKAAQRATAAGATEET